MNGNLYYRPLKRVYRNAWMVPRVDTKSIKLISTLIVFTRQRAILAPFPFFCLLSQVSLLFGMFLSLHVGMFAFF